jgi:KRAB domain-containing zinc finger protein
MDVSSPLEEQPQQQQPAQAEESIQQQCTYCPYKSDSATIANHEMMHKQNAESGGNKPDQPWITKTVLIQSNTPGKFVKKILMQCRKCPSTFSNEKALRYHASFHGVNLTYKCSLCDYAVSSENNLVRHAQIHTKANERAQKRAKQVVSRAIYRQKTYSCPYCPTTYEAQQRLDLHMTHHGAQGKFACRLCDYRSNSCSGMVNHRRRHRESLQNGEDSFAAETSPEEIRMEVHKQPRVVGEKSKAPPMPAPQPKKKVRKFPISTVFDHIILVMALSFACFFAGSGRQPSP